MFQKDDIIKLFHQNICDFSSNRASWYGSGSRGELYGCNGSGSITLVGTLSQTTRLAIQRQHTYPYIDMIVILEKNNHGDSKFSSPPPLVGEGGVVSLAVGKDIKWNSARGNNGEKGLFSLKGSEKDAYHMCLGFLKKFLANQCRELILVMWIWIRTDPYHFGLPDLGSKKSNLPENWQNHQNIIFWKKILQVFVERTVKSILEYSNFYGKKVFLNVCSWYGSTSLVIISSRLVEQNTDYTYK